jgi:uncharacterized metal-binding protein YceD (DUF177 family)
LQHFFAVEKLSTYNIAFKGLAEGAHVFDYHISDAFFVLFENSLVEQADVDIKITLEKRSTFMALTIALAGIIPLVCDRCLEKYDQPVTHHAGLFIKFGESTGSDDQDVIWLHPDDFQFNVAQLIYEYICLSIPLRHVHSPKGKGSTGCNPDMLKKLEEHTHTAGSKTDERWDQLKSLTNKN